MKKAQLVIDAQNGMFQEGDVFHNSKNKESNLVDN